MSLSTEFCERDGICFTAQQSLSIGENTHLQFNAHGSNLSPLSTQGYQASPNAASSTAAMPVYTRAQPELGQFSYVSQARFSWQEREEMKCRLSRILASLCCKCMPSSTQGYAANAASSQYTETKCFYKKETEITRSGNSCKILI